MTINNPPTARNGRHQEPIPATLVESAAPDPVAASTAHSLAELASRPDADSCDLAESAMPELVFGDLVPADEAWVREHNVTCRSCATTLETLEALCTSLDECNDTMCDEMASRRPAAMECLGLSEARYGYMETPVGDVLVAASDSGVCEISYLDNRDSYDVLRELERRGYLVYQKESAVQPAIDQLREYFAHERKTFDLPIDLAGVTPFTQEVLGAANHIPYGVVRTYGDIAGEIGKPRASRAVGNALGRNPVPVIIPCHRVVLASGAMGWYTGGPEIKRSLLGIEGVRYSAIHSEPARILPLVP